MAEIIQFKKPKHKMSEGAQEIFNEMRAFTYKKLLPRGLSQQVADEFLDKFEPIFKSMIPPAIVLAEIHKDDPWFEVHDQIAKNANEQINDYVLKIIGETFHREMMHFLAEQLKLVKE